jgi:hypothetical protein
MIEYLVKRPVGRPPHEVRRYSASFQLKRAELEETRRAVAKVEWHPGELNPGVGFILTSRTRPVECLGDSLRGCCRRFPVGRYGHSLDWRSNGVRGCRAACGRRQPRFDPGARAPGCAVWRDRYELHAEGSGVVTGLIPFLPKRSSSEASRLR